MYGLLDGRISLKEVLNDPVLLLAMAIVALAWAGIMQDDDIYRHECHLANLTGRIHEMERKWQANQPTSSHGDSL